MVVVEGVVFDIDDTLYLERAFVQSGFRHVAGLIGAVSNHGTGELFDHLWDGFTNGLRGSAFDDLLARFPTDAMTVDALVLAYRTHRPDISLEPEARALLDDLRKAPRPVGVISDGPAEMQANKVAALGLNGLADPIVLTGGWGADYGKPHPRAFRFVEQAWELSGPALMYIADNPRKDFVTPRRRGWKTVRLRLEGQLHGGEDPPAEDYAADAEAASMAEVARLLDIEGLSLPA